MKLTYPQTRIAGGSCSLMDVTRSSTPGIVMIILRETTFPTAWTPASVRAARASPT